MLKTKHEIEEQPQLQAHTNRRTQVQAMAATHASTITDTEMPLKIEQTAGGWVGGCGGGITRTSCSRDALTSVKESFGLFEMSDFKWWLKKSMHATQPKGANMRIKVRGGLVPLSPPHTPTPTPPILILLHYYDYCCCC